MNTDTLIPIAQKEIEFYGDDVIAVRMEDGAVYVPVRPLCDLLGVSWQGQSKKLRNDPILSEVTTSVNISLQKSDGAKGTRTAKMIALPLESLNGWLYQINANKVKPEIRESLLRYQRECYRVLFEAFTQNTITVRPDDELMQSDDPAAVAYRQSLAIARIAREHYYLKQTVANHEERLQLIEANLGNDKRFITKEQASHISQGVRAIGTVLSKRSGKNEYGGVYGELYRQWSVSSYKEIPAVKYDDVVAWLRNWYLELVDDSDTPF